MPANTQIKPMKLIFSREENTWNKIIITLDNVVILEQLGLKLFPEMINKEYFDEWELQLKNNPSFNIVEVERFI
jgi:hypothetical protein